VAENDESFGFLVQRNASDSVQTYLAKTNWTIHDDDTGPVTGYDVKANINPVSENAGSVTFTITRSGSMPAETVYVSTVQGSANGYAANSSDYTGLINHAVVFGANQTSANVTVIIINDTLPEAEDTFGLLVQRNSNDNLSTFVVKTNWTIIDDDVVGIGGSTDDGGNPIEGKTYTPIHILGPFLGTQPVNRGAVGAGS
jgi:Calx-beta domain